MAGRRSDFQLRKCTKREQPHGEDRISLLPTEILIYILSFLKLKEAARVSLVSKRWIGLWMLAAVQLDFDASKALLEIEENGGFSSISDSRFLIRKRLRYVKWVNKVLQLHKTPVIDDFRICFQLFKSSQDDIDEWLRYAFSRRVQRLELDLLPEKRPWVINSEPYCFPSCRVLEQDCEKSLNESASTDHNRSIRTLALTHFKSLKSVTLVAVDVAGETLNFLINKFHCLERLVVRCSRCQDLSSVVVCGSSLKHLELTHCFYLESIVVRDTRLASLKITWVRNLVLENVPMLVDVSLINWEYRRIFSQLSSLLPRLEVLALVIFPLDVQKVKGWFLKVPQLTRLKQLILKLYGYKDDSLLYWTSSFMRSSPKLEKFVLEVNWSECIRRSNRQTVKVPTLPLQHLKVFELRGYYGRKADDELVMYFLENGIALERIVLDPQSQSSILQPEEEKIARNCAVERYQGLLSSSVKIVIL